MGCATLAFFRPPSATIFTAPDGHKLRLKPILAASSTSPPPFPSKIKQRKNHLRSKILKTLTKPFPTAPLPEIVPTEHVIPVPITPPSADDGVLNDFPSDEIYAETDKVEELQVSESINNAGEHSGNVGKIANKSVLKFGVYLVGVFLFQAVCAVWVLGNNDSQEKERNLNNLSGKRGVLVNGSGRLESELGNVAYDDDTDLELRINEIRAMAREARKSEKRETKGANNDADIGKEVGKRLSNLEKRLNSKKDRVPESVVKSLAMFRAAEDELSDEEEDDEEDEGLDPEDVDKQLMFKKKFRFRNPSMNQRSKPKGFSGLKDPSSSSTASVSDVQPESLQKHEKKLDKGKKDLHKEMKSGAIQEIHEEQSSLNSKDLGRQKSQQLTAENQASTGKLNGSASLDRDSSRDKEKRPAVAIKTGHRQSDLQTNTWWLKLPYVLAILMRRAEDESEGLFTLPTTESESVEQDSSYTVAFEDRGDAINFCYLLEAFFNDLGDFSASIVPLPTKQVISDAIKVIVVKKGQLKLYAGQPLEEVEMALRFLLQENQIT